MNPKRILLALVAAFVAIGATDFLIHDLWLKSIYAMDAGRLWRAEADMKSHMHGYFIGQFLVAIAFTMLWVRIALGGAGIQCAIGLGVFMGLAYSGSAAIQWAVLPLPDGLLTKWIISGIAQSIFVGLVLFFVYKPSKSCPSISGN
ncbi:MAG: hypothetical protein K8R87_04080 [Verrucomicrobia bacterium]|nr:hypothetical protein [Verrucomicrobiota bacterium]